MWYLHFSWHHEHRQWSLPISRLQHHSFVWVYIRLSKYQGPNTGNPINSSGACEFQVFSQQIVARFGKWNSIFSMRNFFSELKDHLYLSQKSIATKKPKIEFFGIFWKDWLFSCFFFNPFVCFLFFFSFKTISIQVARSVKCSKIHMHCKYPPLTFHFDLFRWNSLETSNLCWNA